MRLVYIIALAALAGLLSLLASGCAPGSEPAPAITWGPAPWTNGERALYKVVDQKGNEVGTSEFSFAQDGASWLISEADNLPQAQQSMQVRVDAATLKPLGEDKTITSAQANVELHTEYKDGNLNIKAKVNGEDRQATVGVPADAIDNDQVLMSLRAVALREGFTGRFTTVVGNTASKLPTAVRVTGKETIETPAGKFETWKTELDFGQSKQYCWYQVEAPRHLVQYDNGGVKFLLAEK